MEFHAAESTTDEVAISFKEAGDTQFTGMYMTRAEALSLVMAVFRAMGRDPDNEMIAIYRDPNGRSFVDVNLSPSEGVDRERAVTAVREVMQYRLGKWDPGWDPSQEVEEDGTR